MPRVQWACRWARAALAPHPCPPLLSLNPCPAPRPSAAAWQEGIVNAVPGCTPLLVLSTLGDGNCLSHAGSLGQFGVHDRDGRLR